MAVIGIGDSHELYIEEEEALRFDSSVAVIGDTLSGDTEATTHVNKQQSHRQQYISSSSVLYNMKFKVMSYCKEKEE